MMNEYKPGYVYHFRRPDGTATFEMFRDGSAVLVVSGQGATIFEEDPNAWELALRQLETEGFIPDKTRQPDESEFEAGSEGTRRQRESQQEHR